MKLVPEEFDTYFEPFIGGGALFFELEPKNAVINDFNSELVNAYKTVKNKPKALISELEKFQKLNSKDFYSEIRDWDRTPDFLVFKNSIERAARFIYLNKTGFNGLWRVNKDNQNNVPYGSYKKPKILDEETILSDSKILKNTKILNSDFQKAVANAKSGDFVYLDPPYIPLNKTANFTSYTNHGFGYQEQIRLRDLMIDLKDRGVKAIMSNSDVPLIRELYSEDFFAIHKIKVNRAINSNGKKRGKVGEVLVVNF